MTPLDPPDVDVLPFGFRPVRPDVRHVLLRLPLVLAAALPLALLAASLSLPLQRRGWLLGILLVLLLARLLSAVDRFLLVLPALAVLLPVTGNFFHGPRIAPEEGAILLAAAVWLAAGRRESLPRTPFVPLLAIAVGATAAGAVASVVGALPLPLVPVAAADLFRNLASPDLGHAALPLRSALVAAAGLFGFHAARRSAARFGATAATSVLVAAGGAVGLFGALEALFGWKLWPREIYEIATGGLRVVSTCRDANSAASFLSLVLFPAVAVALTRRGVARGAGGVAAILVALTLLLTGSRSAWIASALVAVLVGAPLMRRLLSADPARARRIAGSIAALLLLGASVVLLAPGRTGEVLRARTGSVLSPAESLRALGAGRSGFWEAGAKMVEAHPLAGVGPGSVPARFREFRPASLPVDFENVHSWPLQAVAELGLPGGLLVLAPLGFLVLLLPRAFARLARGEGNPIVLALAPGLAAFTISGLVAHPWLLADMQVVFWGAAGLLVGELAPAGLVPSARSVVRVALVLLVVWGVPLVGMRLAEPASSPGAFGFWGFAEGNGEWAWVGPSAFGPMSRPSTHTLKLSFRRFANAPEAKLVPIEARLLGTDWVRGELEGRNWLRLELPVPPPERGGRSGIVFCQVRVARAWCPAKVEGDDRRILGAQLAMPGTR